MNKTASCRFCKTPQQATLHRQITVSGSEQFVWVCDTCKRFNPFNGELFIAKEKIYAHLNLGQLDALPVLMPDASSRCVVCGERKAELHHWAPRAIFRDECERWPKDYLCKHCHDHWHLRIKE